METGVRVGREGRRTYAEVKTRSELFGFTRRLGQRVTHQLPYEPRRGIAFLKEYTYHCQLLDSIHSRRVNKVHLHVVVPSGNRMLRGGVRVELREGVSDAIQHHRRRPHALHLKSVPVVELLALPNIPQQVSECMGNMRGAIVQVNRVSNLLNPPPCYLPRRNTPAILSQRCVCVLFAFNS